MSDVTEKPFFRVKFTLKVVSATFLPVCFLTLNDSTRQSSFRSGENQILVFYIFKFQDIIKCLRITQEILCNE